MTADGFTLGVNGTLPVGEKFALEGRFGMFFWDGNAEINNVSQASPEDRNLYLGAGVTYDVTEQFELNADWTRYELESAASGVASVGFTFQF